MQLFRCSIPILNVFDVTSVPRWDIAPDGEVIYTFLIIYSKLIMFGSNQGGDGRFHLKSQLSISSISPLSFFHEIKWL